MLSSQKKEDPLQKILSSKKIYQIPLQNSHLFKSQKFDMNHLGLSFSQRIVMFCLCLILGSLSFLYAMMNILSVVFNPAKFALPYAFSNLLFFSMLGFVFGFRTYYANLLSKKKRKFTGLFLGSTVLTLFVCFRGYFYAIVLGCVFMQVASFIVFAVSFVPGGSEGISSMIRLMIKR